MGEMKVKDARVPTPARESAEELLSCAIADRTARCSVIGLGYIGTEAMNAVTGAGYRADGHDRSPQAVERFLAEFVAPGGNRDWTASTDTDAVGDADIVLVAVRLPVDGAASVDSAPLESVARLLRNCPSRPRLVLIQSTLPPGTTRRFASEWLQLRNDATTFVAHCPERLQAGNSKWTFRNTPHLVGGVDGASTRLAEKFFSTVCDDVVPLSSPEISELSKLLENAFMATGICLIGEISRLAHQMGVVSSEVTAAAATKPFGYYPFHPGPGIGGHCIPNDLRILRHASQLSGLDTPFLDAAVEMSKRLPVVLVDYLEQMIAQDEGSLSGMRVLLVGVGFKVGSPDVTQSPAVDVVSELRRRGALPVYLDSGVDTFVVDGEAVERVETHSIGDKEFSAGLVLAGDHVVNGRDLCGAVDVLIDAGGGRIVAGELNDAIRL